MYSLCLFNQQNTLMQLLEINEIKRCLDGRNLRHVADKCELNYITVRDVASGKVNKPHMETVRKLTNYLMEYIPKMDTPIDA